MKNKRFKLNVNIMSGLSLYMFAMLLVPILNFFRITFKDKVEVMSIGKFATINMAGSNDTQRVLFKGIRSFFVDGTGSNTVIEFLWYAMMLAFVFGVIMLVGMLFSQLYKKNKSFGFKMMLFSGVAVFICQLAMMILIMAASLSLKNVDAQPVLISFNIIMVAITLLVSGAFTFFGITSMKFLKVPKLSETN